MSYYSENYFFMNIFFFLKIPFYVSCKKESQDYCLTVCLNERHLLLRLAKTASARLKQWVKITKINVWWTYSWKIPILISHVRKKVKVTVSKWFNIFGLTVLLIKKHLLLSLAKTTSSRTKQNKTKKGCEN